MNILKALLVSEITEWWDVYQDNTQVTDVDLRKQYPTLDDAWQAKQEALDKYNTLLKLIRATNP